MESQLLNEQALKLYEFQWHMWEVIGVWFTGFATFIAVWVALYLARDASKVKLALRVAGKERQHIIGELSETELNWSEIFLATNEGIRKVKITDIKRRTGLELFGHWPIPYIVGDTYVGQGAQNKLPMILEEGDTIEYEIDGHILRSFKKSFIPTLLRRWTLRVLFYTAHGDIRVIRPKQSFFRLIDYQASQSVFGPDGELKPIEERDP